MISVSCRLQRSRFLLDAHFSAPGGCVALFGPSGSGKTTIARLIAGLERPDRGRILVGDRVLIDTDAATVTPVHKRRVGLVFQDGQLLPHLSVRQNLDYGRAFAPRGERAPSFGPILDLLGIAHLLEARPATLSGGERQRVAIGRALLAAPRLLVMDEPLASLDAARKAEILPFIERLRDELAVPIIYVSHAVEEVARLATTVVRMSEGRVVAQGTPADVFAPRGSAEAGRSEAVSFLSGSVKREHPEYAMTVLEHPAGDIALSGRFGTANVVRVTVAATNVTLATEEPKGLSIRTVLRGRITSVAPRNGDDASAIVSVALVGGERIYASVTRLAIDELGLGEGRDVYALIKAVSIDRRAVAAFAEDGAGGSGNDG